jgi:hypothetical protein
MNKNIEIIQGFYSDDYNKFWLCVCKNRIALFDIKPI